MSTAIKSGIALIKSVTTGKWLKLSDAGWMYANCSHHENATKFKISGSTGAIAIVDQDNKWLNYKELTGAIGAYDSKAEWIIKEVPGHDGQVLISTVGWFTGFATSKIPRSKRGSVDEYETCMFVDTDNGTPCYIHEAYFNNRFHLSYF
jgi:hypothetical protein